MPVYVDHATNQFGRMIMSHMLADSLEELHAMADRIGLRRAWFQPLSTPHYDVSRTKRALAIQAGAKEIDRHQTVEMIRAWRAKKESVPTPSLCVCGLPSDSICWRSLITPCLRAEGPCPLPERK